MAGLSLLPLYLLVAHPPSDSEKRRTHKRDADYVTVKDGRGVFPLLAAEISEGQKSRDPDGSSRVREYRKRWISEVGHSRDESREMADAGNEIADAQDPRADPVEPAADPVHVLVCHTEVSAVAMNKLASKAASNEIAH